MCPPVTLRPSTHLNCGALTWLIICRRTPTIARCATSAAAGSSTRGEGVYIFDAEGNAILDAMAGLWCVQIGYGRKELADAAHAQMLQLPFYNTFFKTAAPSTVRLAAKIAQLLGEPLNHVFFNNSGSEAIDTIIRIARYYWQIKGEPDRHVIIARNNAYHGSTIAGTSLGGMQAMQKQGGPWLGGIEHVMQPYRFGEGFDEDPQAFAKRAADAIEERILSVGPDPRCRIHRRAGAGRRRRHRSAGRLLAACRGNLPQVRHPLDQR